MLLLSTMAKRADLVVGIFINGLFAQKLTVGLPTLEKLVATEPVTTVVELSANKVLELKELKV